jgi:hypothetical protein
LKHYHDSFKRRLAKPYAINPQLDDAEFVRELTMARGATDPTLAPMLARLSADPTVEAELVRTVADAESFADTYEQRRGT